MRLLGSKALATSHTIRRVSSLRKEFFLLNAAKWLKGKIVMACLLAPLSVIALSEASAETRTLKLYNTHTKERVSITFKKNGRYIQSGLREANTFLRDWRRNESTNIDPKLLDLVWEVYQKVGAKNSIYVVSSYRSPATNNMLRQRSNGVAKNSQHTRGKAMDFYIPGVNLATLRATGLKKQVGGVGYYPRSGSPFVHMDTGSVRHWPRMTRSQLAKVFPDGKTVHIPSDGKPLSGYKVALAEIKGRKSGNSAPTVVATNASSKSSDRPKQGGGFLASLFGKRDAPTPKEPIQGNNPTRTTPAIAAAAIANPPIPGAKDIPEAPIVVAADTANAVEQAAEEAVGTPEEATILTSALPMSKPIGPAAIQMAQAAPNTLEAQRVALETGAPAATTPAPAPTQVAARIDASSDIPGIFPHQKPGSGNGTANDPVAAIAAATGNATTPRSRPELDGNTTLAYASATALPSAQELRTGASEATTQRSPAPAGNQQARRSVSGNIPVAEIKDPLAGFVSLPNKAEPKLIVGAYTTRQRVFAALSHPDQRNLKKALEPGNRFVQGGFGLFPYGSLRTDRFDGPAIVVLPVTYAR